MACYVRKLNLIATDIMSYISMFNISMFSINMLIYFLCSLLMNSDTKFIITMFSMKCSLLCTVLTCSVLTWTEGDFDLVRGSLPH